MEIGTTDATDPDSNPHLPGTGNGDRTLNAPKRSAVDRPRHIDGPGRHHFGHHIHLLGRLAVERDNNPTRDHIVFTKAWSVESLWRPRSEASRLTIWYHRRAGGPSVSVRRPK